MRWLSLVLWLVRLAGLGGDGRPASTPLSLTAQVAVPPCDGASVQAAGPAWHLPKETASYEVSFGIFGKVAKATLTLAPEIVRATDGRASRVIRAVGIGDGAVLGFARAEKHIESDFDEGALAARRWTSTRSSGGQVTEDGAVEASPGALALLRKRTGQPDLAESFKRDATVLDPLSFLLRLRLAPPLTPTKYEILDGRALWIAEVSAAIPDVDDATLVRLDGRVDPVYWNGTPDPERSSQTFTLFLTRDRFHTPVRMVVPYGLGEVRVELVRLERPNREPGRFMLALGRFCRSGEGATLCRGLGPLWSLVPTPRVLDLPSGGK